MAQFFLDSSLQKEGKKFDLLSEEQRNIADQECNKINEVSTTFNIKESSFIIQFTMKKLFIKDFPQRHLQGAPRNHKHRVPSKGGYTPPRGGITPHGQNGGVNGGVYTPDKLAANKNI